MTNEQATVLSRLRLGEQVAVVPHGRDDLVVVLGALILGRVVAEGYGEVALYTAGVFTPQQLLWRCGLRENVGLGQMWQWRMLIGWASVVA